MHRPGTSRRVAPDGQLLAPGLPSREVEAGRDVLAFEASDLDYTILRRGWFTSDAAVDYRVTQKGEAFKGHDVSLNSVSDLIVKLALNPSMEVRRSLGVSNG